MTVSGNKTHTSNSTRTLENAIEIEMPGVWNGKKGAEAEVMVRAALRSPHERRPWWLPAMVDNSDFLSLVSLAQGFYKCLKY